MFGPRWLTMLLGVAFFSHQVGGFLGVWLGGVLFERTGSYDVIWWGSIILGVASAVINLPIVEKPVRAAAAAARLTRLSLSARASALNGLTDRWPGGAAVAKFKAIVIEKADKGQTVSLTEFDEANLMDGDVTVRVEWSTINYKDGLAITGKAPVVRRFPMIPGIDFAGDGRGLRRIRTGSPATRSSSTAGASARPISAPTREKARVKGQWLVRLPAGMSARDAMAIGTAGYTAMLAVMALERHGLKPDQGPVLVTGAAGGVGSVAVALLAKLGFQVIASTGRPQEADYLKGLGAGEIIDRAELTGAGRAARPRSAGPAAIDSVGSTTLANVLSMTKYGGAVAACGLAGGMDLPTSVAPFILRGVSLLGIDSVQCPLKLRDRGLAALGFRPRSRQTCRNDPRDWPRRGDRGGRNASSKAGSGGGSWSRSGKDVQDLATNVGHDRRIVMVTGRLTALASGHRKWSGGCR